ncbi:hypothetical protein [Desulfurivibrio alkaliphilus]|uniref:Periplasmic heavy metal sensor n=1 Tax=Desulfurivibrio alkaliphilus (strain DSM 19089 / UNIQEM U267 / AHT2) TaxID=589865 RepID=D6Z0T8_DESAT|nr:hypothetical protein [Desulfurivibrio alkaliphilus]ADH87198.1 hypothetical protein DaAHT2_2534 [Desulfurivibrio alkaliphilus AHT 2]
MKKTLMTLAMVAALGFTGYQLAEARPGAGYGPGGYGMAAGYCDGPNCVALDEETLQAREAFYEATRELRRTIQTKQAQLQAAINAGDEARAKALSEEVFDLRNQMRAQASEAGIARAGRFGTCGGPTGMGGRGGRGAGPRS